jgi:hypothetical protein
MAEKNLILTNELVKFQVLSKSDFHSSKNVFFCFVVNWLELVCFCYFLMKLDAWKTDFDQRELVNQVLGKKWFSPALKNVFLVFSGIVWTCLFGYFFDEIHLDAWKLILTNELVKFQCKKSDFTAQQNVFHSVECIWKFTRVLLFLDEITSMYENWFWPTN